LLFHPTGSIEYTGAFIYTANRVRIITGHEALQLCLVFIFISSSCCCQVFKSWIQQCPGLIGQTRRTYIPQKATGLYTQKICADIKIYLQKNSANNVAHTEMVKR